MSSTAVSIAGNVQRIFSGHADLERACSASGRTSRVRHAAGHPEQDDRVGRRREQPRLGDAAKEPEAPAVSAPSVAADAVLRKSRREWIMSISG